MKTNLKPYKHEVYSPHSWPPSIGQVVILLDEPRGYVGVLVGIEQKFGKVTLLDSQDTPLRTELSSLLPTGKTPQDLISQYNPSPQELSHNLSVERSFPDFDKVKTTKKGGAKKAKKPITPEQKMFLANLIKAKLKELK